uniref:Kinetochore scaffold 1 n=1 Tax=Balaenoptera musculus TaxID=9771 RepID=A0A8C0HWC3_BALMU
MNTLLCAPIQTQMPQGEISITEYNHERKHANDQTVIFSDENQMDLTASHTVMITKGLLDCTKSEKSAKIDTTSFLANLKLHIEDARMKKELNFSRDQSTSSEKKINFNDFVKRLKTGKSNASPFTGPDKENSEMPIHFKESNRASSMHQMHVSLSVDENSSNMTRLFREQDDGMNFTQCHTANIQTLIPTSSEPSLREFRGDDITTYGNDFMDLTINHTIQKLPSADNLSEIENQTQNVMMDVSTGHGAKALGQKTVFKDKPNDAFQDPSLNPEGDIHITSSHITGREIQTVTQTSNQDVRTLAMISESKHSSPAIQDYKTFFYSSCNDAMELTKCFSSMREEKNLLKHDRSYSKMYPNPDAISLLRENTIYSGEESMDITKSHTVAIDNQIFKQVQTNVQIAAAPVSEKEMMIQNHIIVSEDREMNINYSSVPHVSKERLQQSLENPLFISLTDKRTEIFTDENMDLTKSHIANVGSQFPLASYSLASENTSKSHSHSISPSDEWEEMTKVKSVPDQNSKLPEPLRKSLGSPTPDCFHDKIIICSEKEQNMDLTKSHTVVIGFGPSEVLELGKTNLENTNNQLTTVNRQKAVKVEKCNESPIEKTGVFISNDIMGVLKDKTGILNEKQDVKICERNSLGRLKIDKTVVFSEGDENDMDITKSYTVEINHRPLLDEHDSHLVPLAGTSKTVLYTCRQDDMEVTRSHTTAIECKTVSPDKITTRPVDKTVMFIDNHDELEMTKSHTVFIDYQAKEKTVLPDSPNFELSKRKSLEKSKVTPNPAKEGVFFPDNGESDHSVAKVSQLTLPGEWSNSDPLEKPGFLNESLSGKSQRRKSLKLKNGKTIAFSKNDRNDMDVIQSCAVEINNKGVLEDREDSHWVPLEGTSNTVLHTCGQDDMEITRSHTTALEYKPLSPDKRTTGPMNKTVMFVDNHSDLEVTKSHTVFIDCQAMEKILQEYPKFGIAKGKTLGVSFPKDGSSVQEITKEQALAVENKIVLHTEQKHHVIPFVPTDTLSGGQGETEIKFHSTAVDEEVMKVVVQAHVLEKAKIESCHLNSTDRRNVGFTGSSAAATCGSSDNYSCLPSVVSFFDNLEENGMPLCDKDDVRASHCPVQNDLPYANNLASEYYLKSEGLPLPAPCSLLEKEKVVQTSTQGQLDSNETLVYGEDLGEMTKLNSKQVSCKLPKDQMETFVDDVCVASQHHLSTQQRPLPQQGQSIVSKDETILSKSGNKNLNIVRGNSSEPICENDSTMLNNEKQFTMACKKELKKNIQTAKCNTAIDFHSNSDLTKQVIQTHINPREASDPVIASNAATFSSIKPHLNNLNEKTEEFLDFQPVHIPPSPEQLLELVNKAHSNKSIVQATEIHNVNIVSSSVKDHRDEENKISHNGAETISVPLMTTIKDKVRRCSLGIFLPRLPNKRNCSVTGIDDLKPTPADTTDLNNLETQPVSNKHSDTGFVAAKLNLSPSQYINEENLPIYPGEINSSDSLSIDTEEKALTDTYQKEISPSENKLEETCNSQKRTWVQEEEDDIQDEKKIRKSEIRFSDTAQDQEIFDHRAEGAIDKNANSVLIKSLSRTPSSCSSSLDSVKADGTSLDFSTHPSSQIESQFLRDTVCEESLKEKLKDGRITIKEFFILLQVHILIQKPRQSNLPTKFTINTSPTPEDLMLSQYVYRPKIQIYKEDCEALCQKIEELKLSALNQDKLFTDVNRNLWEKVRHYSDEELKAFGIYLNKIKSRFTKMTKVFTHQGKVSLYSKLVQSAQNLEDEQKDNPVEEWDSEMKAAEKGKNLLELEVQKKQTLAQIDFVQKQTNRTEELLDHLSLSEWDVIEWSDDQAIFTFLYDTVELTITFGEPVVGLRFLDKACRKIVDLNFQSLLDEDKAPPSSLLVHNLIFQYIEQQQSWKKKCTTQHQVPKMLQEISLVVSHCKLLGEEIEFLKRWGPNYNLMNIAVNNTELRLLFCSSAAFAKFEITLSLSAHYPSVPLPFSIQNHLGNIGQDEIAAILSKAPLEDNYLKNVVKQIYQVLLQD